MVPDVLPTRTSGGEKALLDVESDKGKNAADGATTKKFLPGEKYIGTVTNFNRNHGYGFIKLDGSEKKPIFVHWEELITDDPCPSLKADTRVEFEVGYDRLGRTLALKVTLEDGEKIPVYSIVAAGVINEEERYTGSIKEFGGNRGFGFITSDEEIFWRHQTSGDGIYFNRMGIAGRSKKGFRPRLDRGLRVSFKVCNGRKTLNAIDIRKEDGTPIEFVEKGELDLIYLSMRRNGPPDRTQELQFGGHSLGDLRKMIEEEEKRLKERVLIESEKTWTGTIKAYNARLRFGTIHLYQRIAYEGHSLIYSIRFDKRDCFFFPGTIPQRDVEVVFNVYECPEGLLACHVKNIDGSPLGSLIEKKIPEEEGAKKRKNDDGEETQRETKKLKREIVNVGETYTGILKRWSQKKELWVISLKDEIKCKEHRAEKKIYANKQDVKDGLEPKTNVRFKVYVCDSGLAACEVMHIDDMTVRSVTESSRSEDEGGDIEGTPMESSKSEDEEAKKLKSDEGEVSQSESNIKREVIHDGKTYTGTLKRWSDKKKLWVISIKDKIEYKDHHTEKKIHAQKWDLEDSESLNPKTKVTFKVYLGEKGLAAFEVRSAEEPMEEG